MMRIKIIILVGVFLMLSGCAGMGAPTVSRDRFDYTAAISDSWKNQMLFNMVKIRYGDAPVFLDVSSVISQYQIAGGSQFGRNDQLPSFEHVWDPGMGRDVCRAPDHHVHPDHGR